MVQALLLGLVLIAGSLFWVSREDPTFISRKSRELVLWALGIENPPLVYVEHVIPVDGNLWLPPLVDGTRARVVDRTKVAALFHRRKFKELERFFAEILADYEKDRSLDTPVFNVLDALHADDPETFALTDEWLRESPDGLLVRALRAQQHMALGWRVRGTEMVRETGPLRMALMTIPMTRARKEAEALLASHPTFLPAAVMLLHVSQVLGDKPAWEKWRAFSFSIAPHSVIFHRKVLEGLEPRWGGSYEAMEQYISSLQPDAVTHPELRPLAGYADAERAVWFTYKGNVDYPKAIALYDKALSQGESWELLLFRGKAHRRAKNYEAARKDLDRAKALNPFHLGVLSQRLYLLIAQKDYVEAARTGLTLARLDPSAEAVTSNFKWLMDATRYAGGRLYREGKIREAIEAYEIAEALSPGDRANGQRLSSAWHALVKGDATTIKALENVLKIDPDDFDAHVELEIALHHAQRLTEMIPYWDRYIARHGDDLRAFDERGGCHVALRRRDKAGEDWLRACEGGLMRACGRLSKVGITPPPKPGQGAASVNLTY